VDKVVNLLDKADEQLRAVMEQMAKSPKLTQPEILTQLVEAHRLLQEAVTKLTATV